MASTAARSVSIAVPSAATVRGSAVTPGGAPPTVITTGEEKPSPAETVTAVVAFPPATTLTEVGHTDSAKSPGGASGGGGASTPALSPAASADASALPSIAP